MARTVADILRFLGTFEELKLFDEVTWHVEDDGVSFYLLCPDLFYWGTADSQYIALRDLPGLRRAVADCEQLLKHGSAYGPSLWCARRRNMRPQGASYPQFPELWPLFDSCGPERAVGLGNPWKHPREEKL